MFRRGGSSNEGVMTGLVDRKGYAEGPTQSEIYAKEYEDIFSKIQPPKPRFDMGQMGLNLVSGEYAGEGLLQNIAGSAKGPYSQWTKADDARGNIDYQTKMLAAKMGISRAEAEAAVRAQALAKSKDRYRILSKEEVEKEYPMLDSSIAWQKNLDDDKVSKVGGSGVTVNVGDQVKSRIKATDPEKLHLGYQLADDVILTKDEAGNIVADDLRSSVDTRMKNIGAAVEKSKLLEADDALRELENFIALQQKKGVKNLPGIGVLGGKKPDWATSKDGLKNRALLAA